VHRNRFLFK